jgi:hypothetical protein
MSRVRLDLKGLETLRTRLDATIAVALVNTAIIIRDEAKVLAPKDTTALAESIHIATFENSDYEEAMSSAESKFEAAKSVGQSPKGVRIGPDQKWARLPEVRPDNSSEVWVVVGAAYGADIEFNPRNPQPYLTPATLNNKATLTNQIRLAINGLSVKASFSLKSRLE